MTYPSSEGSFVETGQPDTDLLDHIEQLAIAIQADTEALGCAIRLDPRHPTLTAGMFPPGAIPHPVAETSPLGHLCRSLIERATAHPTSTPRWQITECSVPSRHGLRLCRVITAELRLAMDMRGAMSLALPVHASPTPKTLSEAKRRLVETALAALVERARLKADLMARSTAQGLLDRPAHAAPSEDPARWLAPHEFRRAAQASLDTTKGSAAVVVVGIDRFKLVLETFGPDFRDMLVASLAESLRQLTPKQTVIGRIEPDSFALLLPLEGPSPQDLDAALSQIRLAIQQATAALGKPDLGRISLGAAIFPDHATGFDLLLDQAMEARASVQRSGRTGYHVFAPHHPSAPHPNIPERFAQALRDNHIVPYFQPTADLVTGELRGFEVLARWLDQDRGIILAQEFADVFNDFRAAAGLTRNLVQGAFPVWREFLNLRQASDPPQRLAINLTTFDLMNPEFVFELQSALLDHGLDWATLTLEVTENINLDDANSQVFRSLSEFRRRGALIALDDFGTGYAGLRHLSHWPIDILKIDRCFVNTLTESSANLAIVEAVIGIGNSCGFGVIAEGVETLDQLRKLQSLGCRLGQGYLFSSALNPINLSTAPRWFEAVKSGEHRPIIARSP